VAWDGDKSARHSYRGQDSTLPNAQPTPERLSKD
jgi:hypothetical protein